MTTLEEMLLVGEHIMLERGGNWYIWRWWKDRFGAIKDTEKVAEGHGGEVGLRTFLERRLPHRPEPARPVDSPNA